MAQLANITVFDGASTPVSHTLYAVNVTREKGRVLALWREALTGVPMYAQITYAATIERMKSGVYKATGRLSIPVQEVVTGSNAAGYSAAPKVAYTNTVELTGYFHERSDIAGRRTARQMATNLMGNVSTSVAAATSGATPDLMDFLVTPS